MTDSNTDQGWEWTSDPEDPCRLCVEWQWSDEDVLGERSRPYKRDGYVSRVYGGIHNACDQFWQTVLSADHGLP